MNLRLEQGTAITRLLLQVGALCVKTAKFEDAERIMRAVRACHRELPQPAMVLILLLMRRRRWHEALNELRPFAARFPGNPLSTTLLALVQLQLGKAGWRGQLKQAVAAGDHAWRTQLTRSSIASAFVQLPTKQDTDDSAAL